MGRHKRKGQGARAKWFICLILSGSMLIYAVLYTANVVKPAMESVASLKVESMLIDAVNEAVRNNFLENEDAENLLIINKDDTGKITMVQANTAGMNILAAELQGEILENMGKLQGEKVKVPLGTLLGSPIFSLAEIYVDLKVMPLGVGKVQFKTEFESTDINQSHYKVYLEVESQAKVEAPFSKEKVTTAATLLIAETIIIGDVPETYIFIPENNVPDIVGR